MNYSDLDLSILKALITEKKYALEFANEVEYKLLSSDAWNFAEMVCSYVKSYKEVPTLSTLTSINAKQVPYCTSVWNDIQSHNCEIKEFNYNLEKLKNRYIESQVIQIKNTLDKQDVTNLNFSKSFQDIQKIVNKVKDLGQNKSYTRKKIKDNVVPFAEQFNARKNNPELDNGIKTGYSFLDYATNGIRPSDFIIIAGESGFGKSLFLNNIAIQVWLQNNTIDMVENFSSGKNIIYYSLEMPYEDCFNRLLSRLSGVPSRKIENARDMSKDEMSKLRKVLTFIKNYPYEFEIIDIADASANNLESLLTDADYDADALFIDYLGIMRSNEKSDDADWLKQGTIAYEARAVGRKHELPIFTAAQLNRKASGKDSSENIGLSRLARSGTIATHATTVIQIENRPNEEQYPDFLYHIIKNRKGLKGKGKLLKQLSCASLIDMPAEEETNNHSSEAYFTNFDDISEQLEDLEL